MATSLPDPHLADPLLSLRRAIASSATSSPVLTTTGDLSTAQDTTTTDLATATHLYITDPIPQTIPLSTPTRFTSATTSSNVDLRSIVFAWQKKDVAIPEYIDSAQELNEALKAETGDDGGGVQNLVFVERLDLITWLEGASEESEYITPLEGGVDDASGAAGGAAADSAVAAATAAVETSAAAQDSANVASGAVGGVATVPSAGAGTAGAGAGGKTVDPRLQEIYNGERKMGDRNSVLRGIKPTDFSHVRKSAETFLGRNRSQYGANGARQAGNKLPHPASTSISIRKGPNPVSSSSSSSRQPNPIILLSPSASSLLRMTNIKSFLSDGVYVPPDHPTLAASTAPNLLHISRPLRNLNNTNPSVSKPISSSANSNTKPTRFIVVDSTANFRPDYWPRLVAVFTTGQTWQFKSYKWTSPPELFKHATGVYVGWRGEDIPREVKGWGRGVRSFAVDRWDEKSAASIAAGTGGAARWRDREVVEGIWSAIEEGMRASGWGGK